jgi:hypothetical protein
MKNKLLILISIFVAILFVGAIFWYLNGSKTATSGILSESTAIETIKNQFPEFKEYPSDKLAPKSIKTEKATDGWYVAFVQEGSGRPILSAKCYLIDNQKNIVSEKTYNPAIGEDSTAEFSPITCTPGACALETCHGFNNISCGANPPDVCTEIYEVGDKCLQYVKCGVQNGTCQQIQNPQFNACKSCAQKCEKDFAGEPDKAMDCESKCGE